MLKVYCEFEKFFPDNPKTRPQEIGHTRTMYRQCKNELIIEHINRT